MYKRQNLVAAKSGANSDITSITGLTTPLTVAQGGIGAATLTANNVLLGNGTSAPQVVAPSTSGNVLTSNGTTWVSSTPASVNTAQLAKAWVNFAGASGTINDSFNVSSVTRNSTGNYTVNFTTSMANANYAITGCINRNGGAADAGGIGYFSQATGSTGIYTYAPQGSFNDVTSASIAVFSS